MMRRVLGIGALAAGVAVALAAAAPALHLLGWQETHFYPADRAHPAVAAVYVSGDMGLRFGMGPDVIPAIVAHGIPVLAISSPATFGRHRTRAEVDDIVIGAIRTALRETGARRVILMGQSFGADMVSTVAPDLPADLRSKVAAIDLTVPATTAYFRADPMGFAYRGTPDALPIAGMRALRWTPVICVHGAEERDSLCPALEGTSARIVALPGGHFLRRDAALLVRTIVGQLRAIDPALIPS
jgi:type IV secretory pathway VirJ component